MKSYSKNNTPFISTNLQSKTVAALVSGLTPGEVLSVSAGISLEVAEVIIQNLPVGVMIQLPQNISLIIAQEFARHLPVGRVLSIHGQTSVANTISIVSALHPHSILHIHAHSRMPMLQAIAEHAPAGIAIELARGIHSDAIIMFASSCVNEVGLLFRPGAPFVSLLQAAHALSKNVALFIHREIPPAAVQYIINASAKNTPLLFVDASQYPLLRSCVAIKPSRVRSTFFNASTVSPYVCLNNDEHNIKI